ncbi:MAG: hypothetical protein R8G66_06455 [Cytophagales bacterium]|nr:hypothetical protein [Cytophagales bacterium]
MNDKKRMPVLGGIFLMLLLSVLVSCEKGGEVDVVRRIINNTPHDVELEILDFGVILFTASLMSQDTLNILGTCGTGFDAGQCNVGWPQDAEEGRIIFNEERILSSTISLNESKPCEERAINTSLSRPNCYGYTWLQASGNNPSIHTYIISDEDYQNAETVGG